MKRAALLVAIAGLLAFDAPLHGQEKRDPCVLAELEGALDSGGIGGTGILARDGGIGGTGIVGTVTGFGSICVNGLEVHYDGAVPVTWNGLPADASQLAVGQVIAAEVVSTPKGLEARSVAILAAVAGPVSQREATSLTVLGERVRHSSRTLVVGENGQAMPFFALKPGDAVIVSGLRRPDGSIVASRIERAARLPRQGAAPEFSFGAGVTRLWLEGYVERYARGESLTLLGRGIRLTQATRRAGFEPETGLRTFVLARVAADGALVAERISTPGTWPLPSGAPRPAPGERWSEPFRERRFEPRGPIEPARPRGR